MKFNLDRYKPWKRSLIGKISLRYNFDVSRLFITILSILSLPLVIFFDYLLINALSLMIINSSAYKFSQSFPFLFIFLVIILIFYIGGTFSIIGSLIDSIYTLYFWHKKDKDDLNFFITALDVISDFESLKGKTIYYYQNVISSAFVRIKNREIEISDKRINNLYRFIRRTITLEVPILVFFDRENYDKILIEINGIKDIIKNKKTLRFILPNVRKIHAMYLDFKEIHPELGKENIIYRGFKFMINNQNAFDFLKFIILIIVIILLIASGLVPVQMIFKPFGG